MANMTQTVSVEFFQCFKQNAKLFSECSKRLGCCINPNLWACLEQLLQPLKNGPDFFVSASWLFNLTQSCLWKQCAAVRLTLWSVDWHQSPLLVTWQSRTFIVIIFVNLSVKRHLSSANKRIVWKNPIQQNWLGVLSECCRLNSAIKLAEVNKMCYCNDFSRINIFESLLGQQLESRNSVSGSLLQDWRGGINTTCDNATHHALPQFEMKQNQPWSLNN